MVNDIGTTKRHIKPKADSTLLNMKKAELIDYIRCLEHNYNVAVDFNENQARYIESLDLVDVTRCKDCVYRKPGHICIHIEGPMQTADDFFCAYGKKG